MGFSRGKSSSVGMSGQSATQRHASNILFEALLPGSSMTGGYVSQQGQAPVYKTPQQLAQEQAQQQQQAAAARDPKWPTAVPEGVRVGPALQPGQDPQQYFYDSLRPGGDTPAQVPPGYTLTSDGKVVPLPSQPAPIAQTGVQPLAGTGDPIEQTVSRQMGNFVPSARQQGFGALAGHGMTEGFRGQAGPYTDVQGKGMVASYKPLTQTETDAVTKTLLPSLEDMRYKGMFERLQKGDLPEGAASIIDRGVTMASDPGAASLEMAKNIDQAILEGQVLELPELPAVTDYINDAYANMADPLKNVIDDLLSGGLEQNLQTSLDNNVQALTTQAQSALTDMLDDTYGRFAASGVSGGAMLAAAGDVTTKVMADLAGQIASQYQQNYAMMNQERQLALRTVETLIGTAQQERAMDSQRQALNLETTMNLVNAKYGMYTQLAQQFVNANLQYATIIAQEVDRENTEQINSMRMFYEILVSLATGGPALSTQRSKSSSWQVNLKGTKDFLPKDPDVEKK